MRLEEWLKSNGVKQVELARMTGVGQPFISDHINHNKCFGKKTAVKIVKVTKGKVSLGELLFPEKSRKGAA